CSFSTFFLSCSRTHPALHSFPTRRSSDLSLRTISRLDWKDFVESQSVTEQLLRQDPSGHYASMTLGTRDHYRHIVEHIGKRVKRSEEHTSELQSLRHLVCRLLLEKKKNNT